MVEEPDKEYTNFTKGASAWENDGQDAGEIPLWLKKNYLRRRQFSQRNTVKEAAPRSKKKKLHRLMCLLLALMQI